MDRRALSIAKGIGIAAVVFGHIDVPVPSIPAQMYHMALFFLLGGIVLQSGRSWSETGLYLLKGFIGFALLMNAVYLVLSWPIEALWGVRYFKGDWTLAAFTTDLIVQNSHHVSLALTNWFLVAYSAAYALVFTLVKATARWPGRLPLLAVLAVPLGVVGVHIVDGDNWRLLAVSHLMVPASLMLIGYVVAQSGLLAWLLRSAWAVVIAAGALAFVLTAFEPGTPIMSWSTYPSGAVMFFSVALPACFIILWVSELLAGQPLGRLLAFLGVRSKWIMAHHLAGFAIVNLTLVSLGQVAPDTVGALTFVRRGELWPFYALAGFGLSILLYAAWGNLLAALAARRSSIPAGLSDAAP